MIRRAATKLRYIARYYTLRAWGVQWLFVLGHMRSGSSLLVHVLNSNDEILGYGETHLNYVGRRSLVDLYDHVRREFAKHGETPTGSSRYIVDKILWPYIHDHNLLRRVPIKVIVSVRTPAEALPSILSRDLKGIQTPREALEYYSNRLERIRRHLEIYDAPFVLVRYDELTGQPERTLHEISTYLDLAQPLTPEYNTMWSTGERGIGDSSEKIKGGKIVSRTSSYDIDIGEEILSEAREQHQQFLAACKAKEHSITPSAE